MKRPATLILFGLSVVAGSVVFGIAFEVSALEDRLFALNKQIADDRDAIHVLRAEWSYLNQPERLEGLAQRYLDLQPADGDQLAVIATLPARPDDDSAPVQTVPEASPALDVEVASTLTARPIVKPAAPRRPNRNVRLAAQSVAARATPTGLSASQSNSLDAALRAILGDAATRRGSQR